MKTAIRAFIAFIATLSALSTTLAQSASEPTRHEVEVRGRYLVPSGETSFSGTRIDFNRDFDLPNRFGFELLYTYRSQSGKHKFGLDYSHSSYESARTLSRDIDFLGHHYTPGLQIDTRRKLEAFSARYAYRWGNEKVRLLRRRRQGRHEAR